jgi:hypothetical protein
MAASILASPRPIPSSWRRMCQAFQTASRIPEPSSAPSAPPAIAPRGPSHRPPAQGTNGCSRMPSTTPDSVSLSGRIMWS